jgi:hypothetical protein
MYLMSYYLWARYRKPLPDMWLPAEFSTSLLLLLWRFSPLPGQH